MILPMPVQGAATVRIRIAGFSTPLRQPLACGDIGDTVPASIPKRVGKLTLQLHMAHGKNSHVLTTRDKQTPCRSSWFQLDIRAFQRSNKQSCDRRQGCVAPAGPRA